MINFRNREFLHLIQQLHERSVNDFNRGIVRLEFEARDGDICWPEIRFGDVVLAHPPGELRNYAIEIVRVGIANARRLAENKERE